MTDTGDTSENLGGGESHHDSEVLLNEASDDPPFSTGSKNNTCSKLRLRVAAQKLCGGWFALELKKLLKISIAISLSILFQISLLWISLLFLGHLPNREENDEESDSSYQYAAAGLGSSFINITGIAVGHGIATASDTLSSQAYGYKNYKRVGVVLQRGIFILGLVLFPIMALWLNTESLLLLVQQTPCVAKYSALYVEYFTLALPFVFLYIVLQHYLQSQSIVWQFVLIGFVSNILSIVLHVITIYGLKLGYTGAVISLIISNMLPPVLVISYIWCRKLHKETWGGWSFESLREWWLYIKLAVPGLLMIVLEWCGFEIMNILAGTLNETALAVNIVWYQVVVILFMPCLGIGIATSIRVGNELGAGNPQGAKRASYTAVLATLFFSLCSIILVLSTKDVLSKLFVPGNEEVSRKVSELISYTAWIFLITDQMQVVVGGVLRGSGRQYIGAVVNFIAYYIVAIPIGALLTFKTDLEVIGLWVGMAIGNALQCIVFLVVLVRTDWQKESEKAIKRAHGSTDDPSELKREIASSDVVETSSVTSEASSSGSSITCENVNRENLLSSVELQDVGGGYEIPPHSRRLSMFFRRPSYKLRKLVLHGSFFVVGICILIAGGISSRFHLYVDPVEYLNCTDYDNSSYFSDNMYG